MEKNLLQRFSVVLFILAIVFSVYSCDEGDTIIITPANNTISGKITFVDTNRITSGGYYDIGVFPNPSNPPTYWFGPPTVNDTLELIFVNGKYEAFYSLSGVPDGDYVVAVGFRKDTGGQSPIMGVYGCDTARAVWGSTCFLDPQRISIVNNAGVTDVNFLSWADTTNKIY
ncbi:MAG: hypothetical protein KDC42_12130 [Ignavibacteriae bacterium]|nr:hypothetical protein [Ignavibacteriota bacterium]